MRIFITSLVIFIILVSLGLGVGYWKYETAINQSINLQADRVIEIPVGASPNSMLALLEKEGIIKDAFFVRLYWRFKLKKQTIHAGEYQLKPHMSIKEVIATWQKGNVIYYKVTLINGWNFKQVRAALAKQDTLKQLTNNMTSEQIMISLGEVGKHPEGQFFPDTYLYIKGDSDLDILKRAHQRLVKVLEDEWENKTNDLPYETPYQALIMASLIEKETGVARERPVIAGVFIRRLQKNMLLQTDPTVIYGMGDNYKGRITRADLKKETPYNTYVITGLPPTPIAIVGKEAIHAALHPAEGRSLYFVAKGDGSHAFSDNLTEHNKAVRKYQLRRRTDYRSSPLANEVE